MTMYATLEEAIDAAREEFLADNPGVDEEDADVQQLNIQKYVLQDGDIKWQAEFFADEGEEGECLPILSGEGAQAVFDGDYDEIELRQEWLEENTLHEWDEGEFQLEPPLDTEEGQAAADEWDERLASGMYAVDLGACPGGWTYQLVKRNMWVSSVDNGPMAQSLMDTGQVTWLREDGFRYRPTRNNISWMVCDMVEKPAKVAALMASWLVNGWCRETIFNLKLPMKKRYEEVSQNLAYIQQQLDEHGINVEIQARQLYHDREEVTVHIRRWWAAVGGRRDER